MSNEVNPDETVINNPVEEPTRQVVHDPVCHMDLEAASSAGNSEYNGFTYYFCSSRCKQTFDADPAAVVLAEAEHDHGGSSDRTAEGPQKEESPETSSIQAKTSPMPQPSAAAFPEPLGAEVVDESGLSIGNEQLGIGVPTMVPGPEAGGAGCLPPSPDEYTESQRQSRVEKVKYEVTRAVAPAARAFSKKAGEAGREARENLRQKPLLAPLIIVALGVLATLTLRKANK